jgi:hypothetical protein
MLGLDRGHLLRGLLAIGALATALWQAGALGPESTRRLEQVPIDVLILAGR